MNEEEKNKKNINNAANFRRDQENILNLLSGGYYKEYCKLQKTLFDEYIKLGFKEDQALKLVIAMGQK